MSTSGTATTTIAAARSRFSRSASSTLSPPLERMAAGPRPATILSMATAAGVRRDGFQVGQDRVQVGRVVDVLDDAVEERRRSARSA